MTPAFFASGDASTSIVERPSRARPVALVTRPMRLPATDRKPSAASTSIPAATSRDGLGTRAASARARGRESSIAAAATIVETRARSRMTSPLPSGWTRLERKTTKLSEAGSIQSDVPVKPVCPKEPTGKRSPRFFE